MGCLSFASIPASKISYQKPISELLETKAKWLWWRSLYIAFFDCFASSNMLYVQDATSFLKIVNSSYILRILSSSLLWCDSPMCSNSTACSGLDEYRNWSHLFSRWVHLSSSGASEWIGRSACFHRRFFTRSLSSLCLENLAKMKLLNNFVRNLENLKIST